MKRFTSSVITAQVIPFPRESLVQCRERKRHRECRGKRVFIVHNWLQCLRISPTRCEESGKTSPLLHYRSGVKGNPPLLFNQMPRESTAVSPANVKGIHSIASNLIQPFSSNIYDITGFDCIFDISVRQVEPGSFGNKLKKQARLSWKSSPAEVTQLHWND